MPSPAPLLAFLRPLAPPRPSTLRHFLRPFTSTICRPEAHATQASKQEDPNLAASRRASPSYPPNTLTSLPRPKESRASHRSSQPRAARAYPTRHPTHTPAPHPQLAPQPVTPLPTEKCAPNLPYFVTRTPSNELPVYQLRKRGGNLKLTKVRKVDGDRAVLREELQGVLGLTEKDAVVNAVTGHVMLKGHWEKEVKVFLRERLF
ncbi:hypothetical protein LTR53_009829 [Teratosphaeriaceae sp. CCFEE 6253]|nr:hypothetical protein LTR53_009829 [Teratosphaeriaceae sp. CCFEE 6253]